MKRKNGMIMRVTVMNAMHIITTAIPIRTALLILPSSPQNGVSGQSGGRLPACS
ncbi:hypothetical protein [Methanoregula sp.]|uniref:hypothetical protein n=1 Tax=Methanoregula sp. TaxID=2052170 RepID=UPI003C78B05A